MNVNVSIGETGLVLALGLGRSVRKVLKVMIGFVVNAVFPTLTGEIAAKRVKSPGRCGVLCPAQRTGNVQSVVI